MTLLLPVSRMAGPLLAMIAGLYAVVSLCAAAQATVARRRLWYLLLLPVVFFALHAMYGLGTLYGLGKYAIHRLRARAFGGDSAASVGRS